MSHSEVLEVRSSVCELEQSGGGHSSAQNVVKIHLSVLLFNVFLAIPARLIKKDGEILTRMNQSKES